MAMNGQPLPYTYVMAECVKLRKDRDLKFPSNLYTLIPDIFFLWSTADSGFPLLLPHLKGSKENCLFFEFHAATRGTAWNRLEPPGRKRKVRGKMEQKTKKIEEKKEMKV
jgi:hypothetical protein